VKGQQAVDWGLVDSVVAKTRFEDAVRARAEAHAAASDRPAGAEGIVLEPLMWADDGDERRYSYIDVQVDRAVGSACIVVHGPDGNDAWPLQTCRELDHAFLHLRFNEPEIGTWVLRTIGNPAEVLAVDDLMREHAHDWLAREIRLYWARTLRRLELSARTIVALVEPGSCFVGTLAELALAGDRTLMLDGTWPDDDRPAATLTLTDANDGWYPTTNGLSRLAARFWGRDDELAVARSVLGKALLASEAADAGLVTFTPDDIDWDDELRVFLEERNSFSPDALTGMEANFRFVGPETMESKIFARLSAWQNWIFQRPNAVGPDGALRKFGTGSRPVYDRKRV
jgi:benzoyl-CoA-dihydrodiol lyase